MYNQTPSVNLQTAVLMQVQEFVNSGQVFSRYDITKALRQKCNDGLLEIPEVEDTDPIAKNRFDIRKDAVDVIFEQLYQNCLVNGLPPLTYTFNAVLGYRVFTVDPNSAAAASVAPVTTYASPSAAVAVAATAAPVASATNANNVGGSWGAPISISTVVVSDAEIRRRIGLYMDHCSKIGMTPTLRQIQSAIKRRDGSTGLSRRECGNIALSLGYKI